jgi:hypothetical protein
LLTETFESILGHPISLIFFRFFRQYNYGIVFALAAQPKNLPMNQSLANLEIKALEKMYLRETRILKFKLLSGAFKKNVMKQKNRVIAVALAIHSKQAYGAVVSDNISIELI